MPQSNVARPHYVALNRCLVDVGLRDNHDEDGGNIKWNSKKAFWICSIHVKETGYDKRCGTFIRISALILSEIANNTSNSFMIVPSQGSSWI